ncbi:MAG: 4Fe-4S dicluster domain-containing protein [Thermodesulfobacteriota bacterium]
MKRNPLRSRDPLSRREFLGIPRPKHHARLLLDREKCSGCGLCAIDCPTKALTFSQDDEPDTYQILFRQEVCEGCGACEKSCPETCLQLTDLDPGEREAGKGAQVIFEDKISKCMGCGIPLYPRAMMKKLGSKVFRVEEYAWPLDLCPSCRMKSQFSDEILGRMTA